MTAAFPKPTRHASQHAVSWYRSLRTQLLAWICMGCICVLLAATLIVQARSAQLLHTQSEREIRSLAEQTANSLQVTLKKVEVLAATLDEAVHGVGREPATFDVLLRAAVAGDSDVAGAMLILEPGALAPGDAAYHWYVRRRYDGSGDFHTQPMLKDGYDYRDQPWWKRTVGAGDAWWSEPYRNAATGERMFVTYNRPIRRGDDDASPPVGMVSLDIPVDRLRALVGHQSPDSPVQRLVLTPERLYLVHPQPLIELKTRLDERAPRVRELMPLLVAARERRIADVSYFDPTTGTQRIGLVYPVPDTLWTVGISVSEAHALEPLQRTTRAVIVGSLLAVLVLVLLLWLIARPITEPLLELADSARDFARGEFDTALPHTNRRDEVGVMAGALDHARGSIREQMREIEQMGAARQKLESELSIARDIQLAMLPPPLVLRAGGHRLEAHAALEPAKAVGGDFYTFFVRGERHLWFAIGDVSDKGVPAALFMARAMTVLEVAAGRDGTPAEALRTAAERLIEGNDTCMFATVLCGRADAIDGELLLASAGHEPPVLVHADGRMEFLPVEAAAPLGVDIMDQYPTWRGYLQPGDMLVGYTDGITEAFNVSNEAFGAERLLSALAPGMSPRVPCEALVAGAHAFAGGAAQSDDITVLALCFAADAGER